MPRGTGTPHSRLRSRYIGQWWLSEPEPLKGAGGLTMVIARSMENDFSALASRVAASSDVLGCIILSRDGIVVGESPNESAGLVRAAWLRATALGEPLRGFVVHPGEVWGFVRGNRYSVFALATPSSRPGILLDHQDQVLATAEQWHATGELLPDALVTVSSAGPPHGVSQNRDDPGDPVERPPASGGEAAGRKPRSAVPLDGEEVDPVALAREFAGLLQEAPFSDEELP